VAEVIVHARDAQNDGRNVGVLVADDLLGAHLGGRVLPRRLEGPVLGDELARLCRPVHESRAREDELLQSSIRPFGPVTMMIPPSDVMLSRSLWGKASPPSGNRRAVRGRQRWRSPSDVRSSSDYNL